MCRTRRDSTAGQAHGNEFKEEVEIMKKKGVGMSCVLHPTGNKGAGDPSQAAIQLKPDGTFTLVTGAVDLGQGSSTILRQFAADELGVPIENITVNNSAGNAAPVTMGSFASRVTLIDPHAVKLAAEDLKAQICKWAAAQFGVNPDDVTFADNKVAVKNDPAKSLTMAEVGAGVFNSPALMIGTGAWYPAPFTAHDPETGAMPSVGAVSFGACYLELEVDTETGVVDILKLVQAWEVGKAVNPLMCKMQIGGGLSIGLGYALSEECWPHAPSMDFVPEVLGDYFIPTFADYPLENERAVAEVPHPMGVKGAKGFSEGSSTAPIPAIIAALHDALGVWITEIPVTPEVILRALGARG
ncbi:MAG: molybdopterin-dependent oxidoreductase [Desulfobacterales bacterium]|nr:MAG: molybdopterin-dependent oxidoreductase [Desulfobacterales bacterium]